MTNPTATTPQQRLIHGLARELGYTHANLHGYCAETYGVVSMSALSVADATDLISYLKSRAKDSTATLRPAVKVFSSPVARPLPTFRPMPRIPQRPVAGAAAVVVEPPAEPVVEQADAETGVITVVTVPAAAAVAAQPVVVQPTPPAPTYKRRIFSEDIPIRTSDGLYYLPRDPHIRRPYDGPPPGHPDIAYREARNKKWADIHENASRLSARPEDKAREVRAQELLYDGPERILDEADIIDVAVLERWKEAIWAGIRSL